MVIFPDELTIQEQFLKGILYEMIMALIMDGGLTPEKNTVQEFMAKAQAYENSIQAYENSIQAYENSIQAYENSMRTAVYYIGAAVITLYEVGQWPINNQQISMEGSSAG